MDWVIVVGYTLLYPKCRLLLLHLGNMLRGQFTRWPDMCLSAKAPSSCKHLKKHELHLNGGRWGRMLSRAQHFAPLRHIFKPQ